MYEYIPSNIRVLSLRREFEYISQTHASSIPDPSVFYAIFTQLKEIANRILEEADSIEDWSDSEAFLRVRYKGKKLEGFHDLNLKNYGFVNYVSDKETFKYLTGANNV